MRYLVILFFFTTTISFGQVSDSLIYSLRNMDWPLTTFKGQIRAQVGADYGLVSKGYDLESESYLLRDIGENAFETPLSFNISYGITDFLQLSLSSNMQNEVKRFEPIIIQSLEGSLTINRIEEMKGLDDIAVRMSFKWPLTLKKYDLVFSPGISLPMGKFGRQEPLNRNYIDRFDTDVLILHELINPGSGVLDLIIGGAFKYRFAKSAITVYADYQKPSNVSTNQSWSYTIDDNTFNYTSSEYETQIAEELTIGGSFEIQFNPFFNSFVGIEYFSSQGGWEQPNLKKIAIPNGNLTRLDLGADLIITPNIWLRQSLSFPIAGQSSIAPFIISSQFTFNKI